jgi:hypothetical protein
MFHDERVMRQPLRSSRAPLPVLRAAVFAVVGTVLGASTHHLLTEGPVPWVQGAAAGAAFFGLGLVGARRPRHLATVVLCSVVAQSGLHLRLTLTAHEVPHMPVTTAHLHGGQAQDAHAVWHERLHDSLAMTVAHGLVAVLVSVLLHRADAACWTLARGATAALDAVRMRLPVARILVAGRWPAPGVLELLVPVWVEGEREPAIGPLLTHVVVRRGPPATKAALVN